MIKQAIHLLILGTLALFVGCASTSQPAEKPASQPAAAHADHTHGDKAEAAEHGCAACKTGKAGGTAWCEGCKVGYVDGKVVKCKACYQGKSGESVWCAKCNKGYVNKEAVTCEACYKHKTGGEPCAEHKAE